MIQDLTRQASQMIGDSWMLALPLVFLAGLFTSIGPCNMAMVPVVVAYVGGAGKMSRGRAFAISLLFALGCAVTFVALGGAASLVGGSLARYHAHLYYFVALVCIVAGVGLLGVLDLPGLGLAGRLNCDCMANKGAPGAFGLGVVLGLCGSQCATPILVAIVALTMAKGVTAYGTSLLFAYALGRGVPIVLAGTFTGLLKTLPALSSRSKGWERAAGAILILVGLYFIWNA